MGGWNDPWADELLHWDGNNMTAKEALMVIYEHVTRAGRGMTVHGRLYEQVRGLPKMTVVVHGSKEPARATISIGVRTHRVARLLRIGCDAQLACASRLSRFTLLGNDPTLRGLHPCISHRYLTVPFRGARRTDAVTSGPSRGMQR